MTTEPRRPMTLHRLRQMHAAGEKITMLTCYDASFAQLLDAAGVDCLLVGDSLGMVLQGHASTLSVTLDHMAYHVGCVARGRRDAWLVADLPRGSYESSPEQAMASACSLQAAGAQMVKLEGGGWAEQTVRFLSERGVPVCGHLGLTPQSLHALGGWRVQGREPQQAATVLQQARGLRDAGAAMLVLERVPPTLAAQLAQTVDIPVIGTGAGPQCSGQALVLHEMLGLVPGSTPRHVRNFMEGSISVHHAVQSFVRAVRNGHFPETGVHTF